MSLLRPRALPARGDDGNPAHAQVVEVPGDPSFASPMPSPLNFAVHGVQAGCMGDARRKVPRRYLCCRRREMQRKIRAIACAMVRSSLYVKNISYLGS